MYYSDAETTGDLELAQADNNGEGMGFLPLPLLLPLLGTAIGVLPSLFGKKPKEPKGPTKEQIAAEMQAQAAAQQKKYIMYGAIGIAGLLVIGGVIYLARRK